jgi:hypothetical protein
MLYIRIEIVSVFGFCKIRYLFRNTNGVGKYKHMVKTLARLWHLKLGRLGQLTVLPIEQITLFVILIISPT